MAISDKKKSRLTVLVPLYQAIQAPVQDFGTQTSPKI